MKEGGDHRRRESNFKRQCGDLSASISLSVATPDAPPTAAPAIKSNKARARFDLDAPCRGNVQSDTRSAAESLDRVNPGLTGLQELVT